MNCPVCGYYNPGGQARCFQCGLVLPVGAGDAACAAHPGQRAVGACSRCGTFGCGACLAQRGEAWLCPACLGRAERLPWDEREQLGVWRAWWRTAVLMVSSPLQTLSSAEPAAPVGSSVLFAGLSALAGFVPSVVVYLGVVVPAVLIGAKQVEAGPGLAVVGFGAVGAVAYLAVLLGMQVVSVLFLAALDHLALRLLGAGPKSYQVSVRANALALGPAIMGLVPVCGLYVFPLWALVLRVLAISRLHRVSGGVAAAAVLLPSLLLCGGVFALIAMVFGLAALAGR